MSPGLEKVVLCRRCPVGPSGAIPPSHHNQVLQRCSLCGLVWPPIVAATAVDALTGKAGLWPSWLWGLATTVVGTLLFRAVSPLPRYSWLVFLTAAAAGMLVCRMGLHCSCLRGPTSTVAHTLLCASADWSCPPGTVRQGPLWGNISDGWGYPLDVAGQEPIWRGVSLGGSSGSATMGWTVLARLMKSVRNGACHCQTR